MRHDESEISDLEVCKRKIRAILAEYNCAIETDDFAWVGLRDKDTGETTGLLSS